MEDISTRIAKRVSELADLLGLIQADVAKYMGLDINRFNRLRSGEGSATDKELRRLLEVKEDLEDIDKRLDVYGDRKAYLKKPRK